MEQQLDTTYLRPGIFERGAALGLAALGIGMGVLLGAWGISLLWHYTPPEMSMRISNPELHVTQDKPFKVEQDKPFVIAPPEPLKIEKPIINGDQPPASVIDENGIGAKTATGDVIRREVTVFWNVQHGSGNVTTGWNYKDGSGRTPIRQYCYYAVPNGDGSETRVDIASDSIPLPQITASLVPDLEGALAKCQWWPAKVSGVQ
jgi:hypothetical protein